MKGINEHKKDDIRKNVCQDLERYGEFEAKEYCLFHYPDENKNKNEFNTAVKKRINEIDRKIEIFNKLKNKDKKHNLLSKTSYDFRFVCFTSNFTLSDYQEEEIKVNSDFSNAVFLDNASFSNTIFLKKVHFTNAKFHGNASFFQSFFLEEANFENTKFNGDVSFQEAEFCKVSFSGSRFADLADFFNVTFKADTNFASTIFNGEARLTAREYQGKTNFHSAKFDKLAKFDPTIFREKVYFHSAKFNSEVDFYLVQFESGAVFNSTIFNGTVNFKRTCFHKFASFHFSTFSQRTSFDNAGFLAHANFSQVTFEEESITSFYLTHFHNHVSFQDSIFAGYFAFKGMDKQVIFSDKVSLDLQDTRIKKDEKVSFHTVRLLPSWFVNTDSRKFIFTACQWENHTGSKKDIENEIQNLKTRKIPTPYKLLSIACRQLAENAENNRIYEDASNFRKMAFETGWLEKKEKISNWINDLIPENEKLKRRFSGSNDEKDKANPPINSFGIFRRSGDFFIHWLYRITSFYGESWIRALFWFILICPIFALLYYLFGNFEKDSLKGIEEFLAYSLQVMTLQRPEPKPDGLLATLIYSLEIIFTPTQLALLALALRRKFMR